MRIAVSVFDQNNSPIQNAVISWSSSNAAVAEVNSQGLVTARSGGSVRITAGVGNVTGSANVTVSLPPAASRIVIEPDTLALVVGEMVRLNATVLDSASQALENVAVEWSSNETSILMVSMDGTVTAVDTGMARVTARYGMVSASVNVSVTESAGRIVLEPASVVLFAVGEMIQMKATVLDGDDQPVADAVVTWESSDTAIAAVTPDGTVTAVNYGTAQITVRWRGSAASVVVLISTSQVSEERVVLSDLYFATDGENWINSTNWLSDEPLSTWFGVYVDSKGSVTELSLDNNQLSGSMPASIGRLVNLTTLSLHGNELVGEIPPEIGQLINLEWLLLSDGKLTGNIPPEIGRLTNLAYLSLSNNELTGNIPAAIGQLDNVRNLFLGYNNLIGNVPPEIGQLELLEELHLPRNEITGDIPSEIGQLAKMKILNLPGNKLTGDLSPWMVQLVNLEYLDVAENNLSGEIPPEIGQLEHLRDLSIVSNQLSGSIPPEIGELANLEKLELPGNALTGDIPAEIGQLNNLKRLDLFGNTLTGEIPPEIGQLANLEQMFFEENELTGEIPGELGQLQAIISIRLSNNRLSGVLPPEIGNLGLLEDLRLSENLLVGNVPRTYGNLFRLKKLELSGNTGLNGILPQTLVNLDLEELSLENTGLCALLDSDVYAWFKEIEYLSGDYACRGLPMDTIVLLTQSTQSLDMSVPLIAGEDALLRVFLRADTEEVIPTPPITVSFYLGSNLVHRVEMEGGAGRISSQPYAGDLSSSPNALVPGSVVLPGLEMVVDFELDGYQNPEMMIPSRIPRSGKTPIRVRDMPPLDLTLVPILWTARPEDRTMELMLDDVTSESDILNSIEKMLPVGEILLSVREPLWSSLEPVGIFSLNDIEMVHAMDEATGYYMGFVTDRGAATKPGFASVSLFEADYMAHELGHNFFLSHTTCGTSDRVDPNFPYELGDVGVWGFDTDSGKLVPPQTPDVMGYCGPPRWISDYNFNRALNYRLSESKSLPRTSAGPSSTRNILLWGGIDTGGNLFLRPAFAVDAQPRLPSNEGHHVITGESRNGDTIFSVSFAMAKDGDSLGGVFAFILPVQPDWPNRLARITLSGPGGYLSHSNEGNRSVLVTDSFTGKVRTIIHDLEDEVNTVLTARRIVPDLKIEISVSRGIPDPASWR